MKTISELADIRSKNLDKVNQGNDRKNTRIVIGMATCGIAAGAKPVIDAIIDELKHQGITDVDVIETGCIGVCRLEPIVEVLKPGCEKVTYVKMNPVKARKMVEEHIKGQKVIDEYIMHVVQGKVINDYVVL